MTVDEMDLVRELREAAPLRPEAYERAGTVLRAAMGESATSVTPLTGVRSSRGRGRRGRLGTLGKAGIGAGIGVAAAAIALVATSTPRSAAPGPAGAGSTGSGAQAPAVDSKLVTLASYIQASSGHLTGDASLIVKTQTIGSKPPYVLYELYADNGAIYATDTEGALPAAIADHGNLAGPDVPVSVETYQVSRVTLSQVKAGKF